MVTKNVKWFLVYSFSIAIYCLYLVTFYAPKHFQLIYVTYLESPIKPWMIFFFYHVIHFHPSKYIVKTFFLLLTTLLSANTLSLSLS